MRTFLQRKSTRTSTENLYGLNTGNIIHEDEVRDFLLWERDAKEGRSGLHPPVLLDFFFLFLLHICRAPAGIIVSRLVGTGKSAGFLLLFEHIFPTLTE